MGEILDSAEVRKLYFELGEEPAHSTPETFAKLYGRTSMRWVGSSSSPA